MPIIDGDGLANGKRLRKCSDRARLLWPYLFCYSNGFGRFEADYEVIRARVFLGFEHQPTNEELMGVLREYCDAGLLFTYVHEGEIWGQWDTKDKYLKRHKTASDHESPKPPEPAFSEWKKTINENKALPKSSEILCANVRGIGVGVGVGKGGGAEIRAEIPPIKSKPAAVVEMPIAPTGDQDLYEWFCSKFVGPLEEDLWQDFHKFINGADRAAKLRANLEAWMHNPRYADGFHSARKFLQSGVWLRPAPKSRDSPAVADYDPSRVWSTIGKPVKQQEQPK